MVTLFCHDALYIVRIEEKAWFSITFKLTVLSKTRIIRPRTGYVLSWEDAYSPRNNPNVIIVNPRVQKAPRGLTLKDNFGNSFGLSFISPLCLGGDTDTGLKPEESKTFDVAFTGEPLKKTESLMVTVSDGTFGNVKQFAVTIPKSLITIALEDKHSVFFPVRDTLDTILNPEEKPH